jgi:hypothetical protein
MARSLVQLLAARARAARAADDDRVPGVYAVPGPRAQGDECASEPALSADLLDEVRVSRVPLEEPRAERTSGVLAQLAADDPGNGEPGDGGGEAN